jgi:hypothetical protein
MFFGRCGYGALPRLSLSGMPNFSHHYGAASPPDTVFQTHSIDRRETEESERNSLTLPSQTHLHAQLAQLSANLADTENLLRMTSIQAECMRGLGSWHGGL